MSSSIVNYIVDKYLASVLELDTKQTNANILLGKVEMQNLKIKAEIFQLLNLPYLELVNGYVGTIKVKMSMPCFYSNPITVSIDKVFLNIRQKNLERIKGSEEIEGMERLKYSKLKGIEELYAHIDALKKENPKIAKQILSNLHIDLGDIVIRYEDNVSYSKIPFALGLILKQISIATANKDNEGYKKTKSNAAIAEIFQKQFQLKDLSAYMDCLNEKESVSYIDKIDSNIRSLLEPSLVNYLGEATNFYSYCLTELKTYFDPNLNHQYIIHLLNFDVKLDLNQNIRNGKPKLILEAVLPKVSLYVSLKQIKAIVKVISYINLIALYRIGIAKNYYRKILTNEERESYLKEYFTYFANKYRLKKDKEPFPQLLINYEKGLTYDQIQSMRAACLIKIDYSTSVEDINKKLKQKRGLFSIGLSNESIKELNRQKEELLKTEGEVNKKIQAKLSTTKSEEIDKYKDLPNDFLLYSLRFSMMEFSFALIETTDKPMINVLCSNLILDTKLFKLGKIVSVSLSDMSISQEIIKSRLYPYIIATEKSNDIQSNLISVEFNENPLQLFNNSKYRLRIKTEKKLTLIVDAYLFQYLAKSLHNAMKSQIDLEKIQSYAKGEIRKYIQSGYIDKLFSNKNQFGNNIDLDITLFSPMIIVPQKIKDEKNTKCIMMNLGDLSVSSVLLPRGLESKAIDAYDRYVFNSKGIQMSTCSNYSIENNESIAKNILIKEYDINYEIGVLIDVNDETKANVDIKIAIPSFEFQIDEDQIIYLCSYCSCIKKENMLLTTQFDLNKSRQKNKPKDRIKQLNANVLLQLNNDTKSTSVSSNQLVQSDITLTKDNARSKIKFEFTLTKVTVYIMKVVSQEEIARSNLARKNYLTFALNTFTFQLNYYDNKDIKLSMIIGNIFLYDLDHSIEENNAKTYLINKNYQCLISGSEDNQKCNSSFIDVKLNYNKRKDKTDIAIVVNKLNITLNVVSMISINQFLRCYLEYLSIVSIDASESQVLSMDDQSFHNKYMDFMQLKQEDKEEGINPKFFSVVKNKMKQGGEGKGGLVGKLFIDKINNKETINKDIKDSKKQQDFSQHQQSNQQKSETETEQKNHKRKFNFSFEMKSIELNIPIDPKNDNTPLLLFKFNLSFKQKTIAEIEKISLKKTGVTQRENYLLRNSNMTLILYNVNIDILDIKNGTKIINPINEHLLVNFRLILLMNSFLVISSETIVNKIEVNIEPLIMHFGHREIRLITNLHNIYRQTRTAINEKYHPNFQIDELATSNQSLEKMIKISNFKSQFEKTIMKMKKRVSDEKYWNITSFNNHVDLTVKLDKAALTLRDYSGYKKKNIIELALAKLAIHHITNSDPIDSMNMGNALVEMISGKEVPLNEFNIQNLFKYAEVSCDLTMNYYNIYLNAYEPYIEPLSLGLLISQVAKITRLRIDMVSNMININCSSNSIRIFNSLMEKFNQEENKFNKEIEEKINYSSNHKEEYALEFSNYTGTDIEYWLDMNPSKKVLIHTGEVQGYNIDQLTELQGSNAEMNKIQKDIFSFCIQDSSPIESRDYSFNHYENFCIKIKSEPCKEALISLKIETIHATKKVIFDSAISIFNNTIYDGIILSCGKDTLMFRDNMTIKIPLSWMTEKEKVFVQFNENDSKHLLYDSISPFCIEVPVVIEEKKEQFRGRKGNKTNQGDKEDNVIKDNESQAKDIPEKGNIKKNQGGKDTLQTEAKEDQLSKDNKEREGNRQRNKSDKETSETLQAQPQEAKNYQIDQKKESESSGRGRIHGNQIRLTEEIISEPKLIEEKQQSKKEQENERKETQKEKALQESSSIFKTILGELSVPSQPKVKIDDTKFTQKITLIDKERNMNVYIAFDFIGLKSIEYENTRETTNTKSFILNNKLAPLSYVITINPIISFENNTPFELTYAHIKGTNRISHLLKPLEKYNDYSILPQDPQTLLQLTLEYNESTYKSFMINTMDLKGKITLMKSSKALECNVLVKNAKPSEGFNHQYFVASSYEISSNTLIFYFDYIITSRLNEEVFITPIEQKKSGETFAIKPKAINLISTSSSTMIMKSDSSGWSQPFNLNTHGIEGVVSLTQDQASSKKNYKKDLSSTDIAVIFSSSKYLTYSTLIILEPRYLLINELGFDITYKQENYGKEYKLKDKQVSELQYVGNKRIFKIGIKNVYSGVLNVDTIESFDLKVLIYKEDFEQFKHIVFTNNDKDYYVLIRATVNSYDNGLVYIMFTLPQHPFMQIENKTNEPLTIKETKYIFHHILSQKCVPFIWDNTTKVVNELKCCIGQFEHSFSFSRFDKTIIEGLNPSNFKTKYHITISQENNSNTRKLLIQQIENESQSYSAVQKVVLGKRIPQITKYNIAIKGIGISIIDAKPKELFYISLYGIDIKYSNNILKNDDVVWNTMNLLFYLKNFQIDYSLNDSFKNIIAPKMQILPCNEEVLYSKQSEGVYPFVQLLICKQNVVNIMQDEQTEKFPQIDLTIQEFNVKLEQFAIMNLLNVFSSFNESLDFYRVNKVKNIVDDLQKNPIFKIELDTPLDLLKNESNNIKKKILINYLLLSAIKINLTIRAELSTLDVSLIPNVLMRVIGTLGNTLARVTDSPLVFSEMRYENVYSDLNRMTYLLSQHYKKQGIRQIYKLLGSNDLIGNPIKLVQNIGTGFIELFNEPRKGFLKGPSQFGQGLAKGVNSLLSGVVGGGFTAVGTISGTLLSITKNIKGEKIDNEFDDEPENLVEGIADGLKGGMIELKDGLTGVFLDPYRNAKTEGVKGVFKGIGKGFLGVLIAPFSAVFKIINSLSIGGKNTASLNKIQNARFRYPRVIIENEPIKLYDPHLAEAKEILTTIGDDHFHKIIYYANCKVDIEGYTKELSTLILTDKKLQVVYDITKVIFKIHIKKVVKCEAYLVDNLYILSFEKGNKKKKMLGLKNQNICCRVFDIFKYINQ